MNKKITTTTTYPNGFVEQKEYKIYGNSDKEELKALEIQQSRAEQRGEKMEIKCE